MKSNRERTGREMTNEIMEFVALKCTDTMKLFSPLKREEGGGDEENKINPVNGQCREAKKRTGKVWKKCRELGMVDNRETLKKAKKVSTRVKRKAGNQFEDIIARAKDQSQLVYSDIMIRLKSLGGFLTENDKEVCEELNKRFREVFTKEHSWRPELRDAMPEVTLNDIVVAVDVKTKLV